MEISVVESSSITEIECSSILYCIFEDKVKTDIKIQELDKDLNSTISNLVENGEIKGKYKELTTVYTQGKLKATKIVLLGLGKTNEFNMEKLRNAGAEAVKYLRNSNGNNDKVLLSIDLSAADTVDIAQALTEGSILGSYKFKKHITKNNDKKEIKDLVIHSAAPEQTSLINEGIDKGNIYAGATWFVRDMVNESANFMTPSVMADISGILAKNYNLELKVLDSIEMKKLGMGGLLGVSQGSQQPPRFIVLSYKGRESEEVDVAVIGKGITFDSGGISIKPSANMDEMKTDMAGGAAALGVVSALSQFKPKLNVAVIVSATENLPSGSAIRPGDILTIMNGKTVEIISTDAEGRLILADAICYARKMGAKKIIDIATLTGACHISLGDVCTGTFGNNQELIDAVIKAGKEVGECMWQLPLMEEYRDLNKSDIADIKNSGGRYGGAISAAWFLGEFAEDTPWVHLDIAGTAYLDKERGYFVKGATGIPMRTLVNLIMSMKQ